MGQAKLRGTPEQRRNAAIERERLAAEAFEEKRLKFNEEVRQEKLKRDQERLDACKTDGERQTVIAAINRRGKSQLNTALVIAALAGMTLSGR